MILSLNLSTELCLCATLEHSWTGSSFTRKLVVSSRNILPATQVQNTMRIWFVCKLEEDLKVCVVTGSPHLSSHVVAFFLCILHKVCVAQWEHPRCRYLRLAPRLVIILKSVVQSFRKLNTKLPNIHLLVTFLYSTTSRETLTSMAFVYLFFFSNSDLHFSNNHKIWGFLAVVYTKRTSHHICRGCRG